MEIRVARRRRGIHVPSGSPPPSATTRYTLARFAARASGRLVVALFQPVAFGRCGANVPPSLPRPIGSGTSRRDARVNTRLQDIARTYLPSLNQSTSPPLPCSPGEAAR